jgi:hypothetical protein
LGLNIWFPVGETAVAMTPVIGTSFLASSIVEDVTDKHAPLQQNPLVLLACARL